MSSRSARLGAKTFGVACVQLLSLSWCSLGEANPADSFGLGSRSTAMAGAVAADVVDFSASYYNPGALSRAPRTALALGYQHIAPSLTVNGDHTDLENSNATVLGLVVPGHILDVPVAFGVAGHLTGDRLSRVVTFGNDDQRWAFYDDRREQLYLSATVSFRPRPWLSLGGGTAFLTSTDGRLDITGRADQLNKYNSDLQHEVVADLVSVRYPTLGASLDVSEEWRLALVYRGEGKVTLAVDSFIDGTLYFVDGVEVPISYILESTTVHHFVPQQLVLGAHYQAMSNLGMNLDATWVNWAAYESPLSALKPALELGQLEGLILNVPDLPQATTLKNAGLRDRVVLRTGAEWLVRVNAKTSLPLRGGYAFEATPVVDDSVPNLLDASRHILAIGCGLHQDVSSVLTGQWRLDTHLQWSQFVTAKRPSTDPDRDSLELGGRIWAAGVTLGLDL